MAQPKNTKFPKLWSFLLILPIINNGQTETITLREIKNASHVVCITNDTKTPVFLDPPIEDDNLTNSVELKLEPSEWELTYSKNYSDNTVAREQYEEYKINKNGFLKISLPAPELVFSLSISSAADLLEFYLDDDEYMEMSSVRPKDSGTDWNNYTVQLKDREMTLFYNNIWLKHVKYFIPTTLTIVSKSSFYYRIYNYNYYYSERISSKPTQIFVKECMVLYVSTCPNCYLNVSNVNTTNQEYNILGNETWTKVLLDNKNTQYKIDKGTYNKNSSGYWKIRATQCSGTVAKNVIKEFFNATHNHICRTFGDILVTTEEHTHLWGSNPECLRDQYETTCKSLLGEENKNCQGYKICVNKDVCTCPLGYKGPFCEQGCGESEWGFNCSKKCTCSNCDDFTGECTATNDTTTITTPAVGSVQEHSVIRFITDLESKKIKFLLGGVVVLACVVVFPVLVVVTCSRKHEGCQPTDVMEPLNR